MIGSHQEAKNKQEYHASNKYTTLVYLFLFLFLFILSPYFFVFGIKIHSGLVSLLAIVIISPFFLSLEIPSKYTLILISATASIVSIHLFSAMHENATPDRAFLKLLLSVFAYYISGIIVGNYLFRKNMPFDSAFLLILGTIVAVIFINSIIILLEFSVPSFRRLVESVLYQNDFMNINYLKFEHNFRGLASGGGASLSVLNTIGVLGTIWLFQKKDVQVVRLSVYSTVILSSLLMIGRTGIILTAIGAILLISINTWQKNNANYKLSFFYFTATIASIIIFISVLTTLAPSDTIDHSLGLFYGGFEGLRRDGTLAAIYNFYHLPDQWQHLLIGVGNFSGAFEDGVKTDSGFMKVFTATGLIGSVILYAGIINIFYFALRHRLGSGLLFVLIGTLFIAEIKEPFLIQGYSARVIWLLLGVNVAYLTIEQSPNRNIE